MARPARKKKKRKEKSHLAMDSDDEDVYSDREQSVKTADGVARRTRTQGPNDKINNDVAMLHDDSDDEGNNREEDEDDDDGESYGRASAAAAKRAKSASAASGAGGSNKPKRQKVEINDQLKGANGGYAWEDEIKRSWDIVKEDKDGSLVGLVSGLVEANKMKKIYKNVTPFQRGIIRTLILVIDCSQAMAEKDLRPTRYSLTITYALEFIGEFFDQNPISQLGIVAMRNGIATVVSEVSGNPVDHINNLKMFKKNEPKGDPSLQNALEMSRGLLLHTSPHSTKEVLILFGTLFTSDPGDIFKTVNHLVEEKIRVRIIGLNAQVSICSKIVNRTNFGDGLNYGIVLNEQHFKELLTDCITPMPILKQNKKLDAQNQAQQPQQQKIFNLIKMGFPTRITEEEPSFCSCHSNLNYGGYICPFCKAKICSLPAICPTCNLMLISSTHLARSYHHLFPLKNYKEVPLIKFGAEHIGNDGEHNNSNTNAKQYKSDRCYSCQLEFPVKNNEEYDWRIVKSSSRYECEDCKNDFCIDCNVFIHETLHNCPGCEAQG